MAVKDSITIGDLPPEAIRRLCARGLDPTDPQVRRYARAVIARRKAEALRREVEQALEREPLPRWEDEVH